MIHPTYLSGTKLAGTHYARLVSAFAAGNKTVNGLQLFNPSPPPIVKGNPHTIEVEWHSDLGESTATPNWPNSPYSLLQQVRLEKMQHFIGQPRKGRAVEFLWDSDALIQSQCIGAIGGQANLRPDRVTEIGGQLFQFMIWADPPHLFDAVIDFVHRSGQVMVGEPAFYDPAGQGQDPIQQAFHMHWVYQYYPLNVDFGFYDVKGAMAEAFTCLSSLPPSGRRPDFFEEYIADSPAETRGLLAKTKSRLGKLSKSIERLFQTVQGLSNEPGNPFSSGPLQYILGELKNICPDNFPQSAPAVPGYWTLPQALDDFKSLSGPDGDQILAATLMVGEIWPFMNSLIIRESFLRGVLQHYKTEKTLADLQPPTDPINN